MKLRGYTRAGGKWALAAAAVLSCAVARPALAQVSPAGGPNSGALTFTGGLDVPSVYVYRGIVQEGDPKVTLTPHGDLGIRLASGEGPFAMIRVNLGVWNSLNTGTSGTGGPLKALHYAEQFYTSVTLGLGKGLTFTPEYRANTSPNRGYATVQEINFTLASSDRIAPYALVAFELSDTGQLDGGSKKGTYLELGVGPTLGLPFWNAKLTVPVKAGFSLRNYYEVFGSDLIYHDHGFGFIDPGILVTVPLSTFGSQFGSWTVHGGADVLTFGDATRAFNRGQRTKVVVLVGIGVTY
jgi:hypothetical protein